MVTQLNPPLPMSCPKGEGFAHFLIDYGPESDLYWTIFVMETGEVWTYANKHVRASKSITPGRTLAKVEPPLCEDEGCPHRGKPHVCVPSDIELVGIDNEGNPIHRYKPRQL